MSRQVSRGSAGDYQADEQAGVAGLRWRAGTKVTARSSLIMGWFPCAAAVLGSPNAQGKPAQHIHLPLFCLILAS